MFVIDAYNGAINICLALKQVSILEDKKIFACMIIRYNRFFCKKFFNHVFIKFDIYTKTRKILNIFKINTCYNLNIFNTIGSAFILLNCNKISLLILHVLSFFY
ncbi:hypothetical protein H311_02475 [Anncaliia algerae PRA109]|nr:hypothetical protein H311_02475 [Anncaliia algerae PRA109]